MPMRGEQGAHLLQVAEERLHLVRGALVRRIAVRKRLAVELFIHLLQQTLERREAPAERARVELEVDLGDVEAGRL